MERWKTIQGKKRKREQTKQNNIEQKERASTESKWMDKSTTLTYGSTRYRSTSYSQGTVRHRMKARAMCMCDFASVYHRWSHIETTPTRARGRISCEMRDWEFDTPITETMPNSNFGYTYPSAIHCIVALSILEVRRGSGAWGAMASAVQTSRIAACSSTCCGAVAAGCRPCSPRSPRAPRCRHGWSTENMGIWDRG